MYQDFTIHPFGNKQFVIHTKEGRNILVNQSMLSLLEILQSSGTLEEAYQKFLPIFDQPIDFEKFQLLVNQKFAVFKGEGEAQEYRPSSYLKLRMPLLSATNIGMIADPFKVLFSNSIFYVGLVLLVAMFISCSFYFQAVIYNVNEINYTLTLALFYASILIHELGHIAACRKAGVRHGEIGFGFYLIFPVMYANISNVWTATKAQRIIANLGGIYMECLYATLLLLVYLASNDYTYLLAYFLIIGKTLMELNPFIRNDGYWLLSDLSNTPNLLGKANKVFREAWKPSSIKQISKISLRGILLFFYALVNQAYIFAFAYIIISNYYETLLDFPFIISNLLYKALTFSLEFADFKREYILVALFYFLSFNYLIKKVRGLIRVKHIG